MVRRKATRTKNGAAAIKNSATDYPVEGAEKPPTTHERRGRYKTPDHHLQDPLEEPVSLYLRDPSSRLPQVQQDHRDRHAILRDPSSRLPQVQQDQRNRHAIPYRAPYRSPHATYRSPHATRRSKTTTARDRLHGYTPHLIAASTDNGRTRIAPDDNGPKAPTPATTKMKNTRQKMTKMTTTTTRVEQASPNATLLRHHHHRHRHIIIVIYATSAHHHHKHQRLLPAPSNAGNLPRVHDLLGCRSDSGRLLCVSGGSFKRLASSPPPTNFQTNNFFIFSAAKM